MKTKSKNAYEAHYYGKRNGGIRRGGLALVCANMVRQTLIYRYTLIYSLQNVTILQIYFRNVLDIKIAV